MRLALGNATIARCNMLTNTLPTVTFFGARVGGIMGSSGPTLLSTSWVPFYSIISSACSPGRRETQASPSIPDLPLAPLPILQTSSLSNTPGTSVSCLRIKGPFVYYYMFTFSLCVVYTFVVTGSVLFASII